MEFDRTSITLYEPVVRCFSLLWLDFAMLLVLGGLVVKSGSSMRTHWLEANFGLVGTLVSQF